MLSHRTLLLNVQRPGERGPEDDLNQGLAVEKNPGRPRSRSLASSAPSNQPTTYLPQPPFRVPALPCLELPRAAYYVKLITLTLFLFGS